MPIDRRSPRRQSASREPRRSAELPKINADVWHGPAADYVAEIAAETEADPLAVLLMVLAWCGCLMGNETFVLLGSAQPPRLWPLLVGKTASGRKGTAEEQSLSALSALSAMPRRATGLSSGEGLLTAFLPTEGEPRPDPRLIVVESEFEAVLAQLRRLGNVLSAVLRDAWDGKPLGAMTVQSRQADNHHLVVVGQITPDAYRSGIDNLILANGFLNRFMPISVARPHLVPLPNERGPKAERLLKLLVERSGNPKLGAVQLNRAAGTYYRDWYTAREENRGDLAERVAQATGRGPQNLIRIALILAMLDRSDYIRIPHLKAAEAIVGYVDTTAMGLIGPGQAGLDARIVELLRALGGTLPKDQIRRTLRATAINLDEALHVLQTTGQARVTQECRTGGRPKTTVELLETPDVEGRKVRKVRRRVQGDCRLETPSEG